MKISPPFTIDLRGRIDSLRAEILAARKKEVRVREAINSRLKTLSRLEAQLALGGERGAALAKHE